MSALDDLLRELRRHPEWRDKLRRELLTDELLHVPETLATLVEAQARTEARVEELAEALHTLAEPARATAEVVEQLVVWSGEVTALLRGIASELNRVSRRADSSYGWMVEFRYRERPWSFFGRIARRLRHVPIDELDDLLEEALAAGVLTEEDAEELRRADGVFRGRRDGREVYLVLEASGAVDERDVRRAVDRAALLARTGRSVLALVAGEDVSDEASHLALNAGAWQVTDGRVVPPSSEAA